ncbi:hypothetical protein B0A48_04523 [Cryoendolithus antarcticus]|uniref:Uncharacterized protein n=1 Tax=Cryoendolithus antarcticus TaxID=1507870 RepID=A0A1V8TFK8_9PEZI|nr:hypothetical protein B0A48_04523 [Cryoendolithus antarcticus]
MHSIKRATRRHAWRTDTEEEERNYNPFSCLGSNSEESVDEESQDNRARAVTKDEYESPHTPISPQNSFKSTLELFQHGPFIETRQLPTTSDLCTTRVVEEAAARALVEQASELHRREHLRMHLGSIMARVAELESTKSGTVHPPMLEPRLPCLINETKLSALLDNGARNNFVSLAFARRQGLEVKPSPNATVTLPNGIVPAVTGAVEIALDVLGGRRHLVQFQVLTKGVTDIILGQSFIAMTKAFSTYRHRIIHTIRDASSSVLRRVCYLDGPVQQVGGYLNGNYVEAVPDTGSQVTLISSAYARSQGHKVSTEQRDQINLQFADGSTTRTSGLVRDMEWSFAGQHPVAHQVDAYVLDDLVCDVLLSYDLLYRSDAFGTHEEALFSDYDYGVDRELERNEGHPVGTTLNCVQIAPNSPNAETAEQVWTNRKLLAWRSLSSAKLGAQALPVIDQSAFLAPFYAECKAW